jgi:hypothetical protein
MEQKNSRPEESGQQNDCTPNFTRPMSPRQRRVVNELLDRALSREEVDGVAKASNGPAVIQQLRRRGLEIDCKMVAHEDSDGLAGEHGVYSLPVDERAAAIEMLRLDRALRIRQSNAQLGVHP